MNPRLILIAVALVLLGLLALLRWKLRKVLARAAIRAGVPEFVLGGLADAIHLVPRPGHAWADPAAHTALAEPLRGLGFFDVGPFEVPELPGTCLALSVQVADRAACAIYEHPKVGPWIEFFAHYPDGRRFTSTSRPSTGLDPAPGATVIHAPGVATAALYRQFLHGRPKEEAVAMTPEGVVARFEAAWAESIAWRKKHGISEKEIERGIEKRPIRVAVKVNVKPPA